LVWRFLSGQFVHIAERVESRDIVGDTASRDVLHELKAPLHIEKRTYIAWVLGTDEEAS
jgi:hypothetical protein